MPGSFTIRPIEAKLTHSTELISKMSPYVSVNLGNQKFDGQVSKKGNKTPIWNDVITLPISNEPAFILNVKDKDRLTKDDLIGSAMINMRDLQTQSQGPHWFPLYFKNKPAGEILLDVGFQGGNLGQQNLQSGFGQQNLQSSYTEKNYQSGLSQQSDWNKGTIIDQRENILVGHDPSRFFTEQHQSVQSHTFMKNVEVTDTVPVNKQIEVMEPRKVLKDVEYTQAVPVQRQIEIDEPHVVSKTVEVIEPRLVTKTIEVIENVPVKRQVDVVEMVHSTKTVNSMEPHTFHKQVEVTEYFPVKKQVQVSEPRTYTKQVEFEEPVITTQTITKEIRPEVIVNTTSHTEVGPATLIREAYGDHTLQQSYISQYQQQNLTNQFSQMKPYHEMTEQERVARDHQLMEKEDWNQSLLSWRNRRKCSAHRQFECDQSGCYDKSNLRWL